MKKVLLTIVAAVTLMSCSPEAGMVETFEGGYINYETLVNDEVQPCTRAWSFNNNVLNVFQDSLVCGPDVNWSRPFTFTDTTISISQPYGTTIVWIEYDYSVQPNGNLVLIHQSGDYTITYKLTR